MSMAEALRHLRGNVPWLSQDQDGFVEPPSQGEFVESQTTPQDEAEVIVQIAIRDGRLDRESPTWIAVSKWAATELIKAQRKLELADGDKVVMLQSRCWTLRDLLEIDKSDGKVKYTEDIGPSIP